MKNFTRIVSAFVFISGVAVHISGDTLSAIYVMLVALYLIHVSETL